MRRFAIPTARSLMLVRRLAVACLILVPALSLMPGIVSAAGSKACTSTGSQPATQSECVVMPGHGAFSLTIPGTNAVLIGAGTPDRAGKPITINRVPLVCPSLGGFGIRIITPTYAGLLPPLHWSGGTLYYRDRTTGQCVGVASPALAAAPGTYQVVAGTGVSSMPSTGGGAGSSSQVIPPLLVLGVLFVLLGFRVGYATRR
jgi:hypothetical protein